MSLLAKISDFSLNICCLHVSANVISGELRSKAEPEITTI